MHQNDIKIGKLISVSGANNFKTGNPEFDEINKTMFVDDVKNFKKLCQERICIYSKDDPYIPLTQLQDFAKQIDAQEIVYEKSGHFNKNAGYTKFEDLLKLI